MGHTIYLVGARAAGKTTFGGALARQLGCNYVDTDIHLRETTGETVADIVAREGWDGFRKRESAVLRAVTAPGTVIATGGGMVLTEENRRFMRENGIFPPRPRSLHPACKPIPTPHNAPHLPGNPLRKRWPKCSPPANLSIVKPPRTSSMPPPRPKNSWPKLWQS